MDLVYHLIAIQHPGTLLVLGAAMALVGVGLLWLALRIIQYRRWASEAPQRELAVIASGLSSLGRQGRLPLPSPTVGSHLDGSTPRAASPRPPLGDPRPSSPPSTVLTWREFLATDLVVYGSAFGLVFASVVTYVAHLWSAS